MTGMVMIALAAISFGLAALGVLLWAIRSGQYDDPDGDAARILLDDDEDR
jgi:cbb3-type cytochrome oxidase maturation protein